MKYTGPKAKRCRRHGVNLYGSDKYDKILQKKPYGPGKSPRTRPGRKSEYSKQLVEKQKARDMYGMSEKQFYRLYEEASRTKGQTGDRFKQLLERRLDNVVYRAGFALTRLQARQLVSHGHFLVDGKRVTVGSYRVRPGEKIALRDRSRSSPLFASLIASHEKYMPPSWIRVIDFAIEIASDPAPEDAEQGVDARQIIEFYSR